MIHGVRPSNKSELKILMRFYFLLEYQFWRNSDVKMQDNENKEKSIPPFKEIYLKGSKCMNQYNGKVMQ